MIIAAGLSPAWQQILEVNSLKTGEVNRCQSAQWCASGKVVNVGIALQHLDSSSETIFPAGGYAKSLIESELRQLDVPSYIIPQKKPTRICTTILDLATQQTTELVENATSLSSEEIEDFSAEYIQRAATADVIVLTGSLPAGVPTTFYRDLIASTNCPVILDARGDELHEALTQDPFLVKPNHEELERTLSRSLSNTEELIKGMQEINHRGATWVVISQEKDALWATSIDRVFRFTPPAVKVVNPIGCGDSLAAGIASAIEKGESVPEAIRWGMGSAADNLTQLLPARLSVTNVRSYSEQVKTEQIV